MKHALKILAFTMLATACNPLTNENGGSFKSSDFNPGLSSTSPTPAPTATPVPTATPMKVLDVSWTPHFSDLDFYLSLSGTPGSSIASGTVIAGAIASSASVSVNDAGATYGTSPTASSLALTAQQVQLTGNDESLNFGHGTNHDFTVMTWMKFSSVSRWGRLISNGGSNFYNGWFLQVSPDLDCGHTYDGSIYFGLGAYSGAPADVAQYRTVNTYNDGLWHHVAMTVQQIGSRKVTLYVDGAVASIVKMSKYDSGTGCGAPVDSCGTITGNVADFTACTSVNAGNQWAQAYVGSATYQNTFDGNIAETAVFKDAVLTGSEISTIYLRQK